MDFIDDYDEEKQMIITPNRRLSATLNQLYNKRQQEKGLSAWKKPTILPMRIFIESLWQTLTPKIFAKTPLLLRDYQERFLWESLISQSPESEGLLQVSGTADLAMSGYELLCQWQVDIHHLDYSMNADYSAFKNWVIKFRQYCQDNHMITFSDVPSILTQHLIEKKITSQKDIITFGFIEFPPQWEQLLSAYQHHASLISYNNSNQLYCDCKRLTFEDQDTEVRAMARWAKENLAFNQKLRIACVIPNLNVKRDRINQLFTEVFAESSHTIEPQKIPFNISAGKPLAQYPIIYMALTLLSLYRKAINFETLNTLLLSSFVGDALYEKIRRAEFDKRLRKKNILSLNLAELCQKPELSELNISRYCPKLNKRLNHFYELLSSLNEEYAFKDWAIIFSKLLNTLGWPGDRSLNSEEYQIVEHWQDVLAELSGLDILSQPVNYHKAYQTLYKIMSQKIFQAKTPEVNIQILGLLEAAGLPFDALWVSGLDDFTWPGKPNPHPFIPLLIQKQLNMPHANSTRELHFSLKLTQQFVHAASQVFFSYSNHVHDLEVNASPLISAYQKVIIIDILTSSYATPSEIIFKSQQLEEIIDNQGPFLSNMSTLRGGIHVIKSQAICPFKAFAEWRLFAEVLELPMHGLNAKDRGMIIHKIMELLWRDLKTQQQLKEIPDEKLRLLVEDCIGQALKPFHTTQMLQPKYLNLEEIRLTNLINKWLVLEKTRPPFEVLATEKKEVMTFADCDLTLRIDRIDKLDDGRLLIIDYKSGKKNQIDSWFSDRPEEPQLPFYSLNYANHCAGISFAQINPQESKYVGISRDNLDIQGIKVITDVKVSQLQSWNEQFINWQDIFSQLSHDFSSGEASVDPKKSELCQHCQLKPFCRIHEGVLS